MICNSSNGCFRKLVRLGRYKHVVCLDGLWRLQLNAVVSAYCLPHMEQGAPFNSPDWLRDLDLQISDNRELHSARSLVTQPEAAPATPAMLEDMAADFDSAFFNDMAAPASVPVSNTSPATCLFDYLPDTSGDPWSSSGASNDQAGPLAPGSVPRPSKPRRIRRPPKVAPRTLWPPDKIGSSMETMAGPQLKLINPPTGPCDRGGAEGCRFTE